LNDKFNENRDTSVYVYHFPVTSDLIDLCVYEDNKD